MADGGFGLGHISRVGGGQQVELRLGALHTSASAGHVGCAGALLQVVQASLRSSDRVGCLLQAKRFRTSANLRVACDPIIGSLGLAQGGLCVRQLGLGSDDLLAARAIQHALQRGLGLGQGGACRSGLGRQRAFLNAVEPGLGCIAHGLGGGEFLLACAGFQLIQTCLRASQLRLSLRNGAFLLGGLQAQQRLAGFNLVTFSYKQLGKDAAHRQAQIGALRGNDAAVHEYVTGLGLSLCFGDRRHGGGLSGVLGRRRAKGGKGSDGYHGDHAAGKYDFLVHGFGLLIF